MNLSLRAKRMKNAIAVSSPCGTITIKDFVTSPWLTGTKGKLKPDGGCFEANRGVIRKEGIYLKVLSGREFNEILRL